MAELKEDSLTYETFKNLLAKEFDRFNPQPESKRKLAQASEYRAMAQALVGTWIGVSNGESGPDVLQVASLPHNTIYFIRDFSLCAHANLQETLTFKEPIPWKNDAGCGMFCFLRCKVTCCRLSFRRISTNYLRYTAGVGS